MNDLDPPSHSQHHQQASTQDNIDEALTESFPASDSPAWSMRKLHEPDTMENHREKTTLVWRRNTADFDYEVYNRDALLTFSGGESMQLSNPEIFFGDARFANSEALLTGALSFCYMHTFLAIASKQKFKIKQYTDQAVSRLGENEQGKVYVAEIQLNPQIIFEQTPPTDEQLVKLQESAHHHCFVANSICSNIMIVVHAS